MKHFQNKGAKTLFELLLEDLHETQKEIERRVDAGQTPLWLLFLYTTRRARLWFWANYRGGKTVTCPEWTLRSWWTA